MRFSSSKKCVTKNSCSFSFAKLMHSCSKLLTFMSSKPKMSSTPIQRRLSRPTSIALLIHLKSRSNTFAYSSLAIASRESTASVLSRGTLNTLPLRLRCAPARIVRCRSAERRRAGLTSRSSAQAIRESSFRSSA